MDRKKASISFQSLIWVFRIIFIIIMCFSVIFMIGAFISTHIDVFEAEADIFFQRLIHSKNGISYYNEEIDRLYPLVIDLDKLKSDSFKEEIEKSIYYGDKNKQVGARIHVQDLEKKINLTLFYNKEFYNSKKVLVDAKLTEGPGGARAIVREISVLVKEGQDLRKGMLLVEVVIQND